MFNKCGIIGNKASYEALLTLHSSRLPNLLRRFFAMPESYHVIQPPLFPFLGFEHTSPDCICPGNLCSSCKTVKCHAYFHKNPKYGLDRRCKPCRKAYDDVHNHEYRISHREELNAKARAFRQAHPEHCRSRQKAWNDAHRERVRAQTRTYLRKEKWVQYRRSEAYKEKRRQQRAADPEQLQAYEKAAVHKRRARKIQAGGSFDFKEWKNLKAYYNAMCLCCGRREAEITLHT